MRTSVRPIFARTSLLAFHAAARASTAVFTVSIGIGVDLRRIIIAELPR